MKKIGLGLLALAVFTVMAIPGGCAKKSAGLSLTNAYAQVQTPAPKAAPAKKVEVKLTTGKGTITTVDVKAGTFSLKEANAAAKMTFKASVKLIKALKAGENVVVSYTTRSNGEKEAVYVTKKGAKKVKIVPGK